MLEWFPMTTEKEIEDALQCWIGFCRWSCSVTATVNHVPCAIGTLFLMPYKKVAHHCLFKLIVDPHWQRKGIGNAMIRNLKHLAKNYFHLEMISIEFLKAIRSFHLLKKMALKRSFARRNLSRSAALIKRGYSWRQSCED
jgi:GNAT superfamily N-acetyltransferase